MNTPDQKHWVYGDVFGITRLTPGKIVKVKTTTRATASTGALSISADSKLLLSSGRLQTGVYGKEQMVMLSLPGLGLKMKKLPWSREPVGLLSTDDGIRVVKLEGRALTVYCIEDEALVQESALKRRDTGDILTYGLGPTSPLPCTTQLLTLNPDGKFLAFDGAVLWSGNLIRRKVAWRRPVKVHPDLHLSAQIAGDQCVLMAMDHATDTAHILAVTSQSSATIMILPSLCVPSMSRTHMATQPDSNTVTLYSRTSTESVQIDVSAHNVHPRPAPDDRAFHGARPPAPTRLVGALHVDAHSHFFVPWHAETIVDLRTNTAIDRGLPPGSGPIRRLLMEIQARNNAALAPLQVQSRYREFDTISKDETCRFTVVLPQLPSTLRNAVATDFALKTHSRFSLNSHGWRLRGSGSVGGAHYLSETADLAEVRFTLAWMRTADWLPLDCDSKVLEAYTNMMGIPFRTRAVVQPMSHDGERLWLRAMLETIRHQGWPEATPKAWESEPITAEMVRDVVPMLLNDWPRYRAMNALQGLSLVLISHLGPDAAPALLALLRTGAAVFNWTHHQSVGAALTWLCRHHPHLCAQTISSVEAIENSTDRWAIDKAHLLKELRAIT